MRCRSRLAPYWDVRTWRKAALVRGRLACIRLHEVVPPRVYICAGAGMNRRTQSGLYCKTEVDSPSGRGVSQLVECGGHCAVGNVFYTRQHMHMEEKIQPSASF
jgi:hypothetical protein